MVALLINIHFANTHLIRESFLLFELCNVCEGRCFDKWVFVTLDALWRGVVLGLERCGIGT